MANGRFVATGICGLNALDSKYPFIREGKTSKGASYKSFNMSVAQQKNNRMNVELFGMKVDTIKTKDQDNNDIEVSWNDRDNSDVVNSVASYRKNTVSIISDDPEHFISPYDTIDYLVENANDIKGKKVTVTGNVKKSVYDGQVQTRFEIQNIYTADDDTKCKLSVNTEFFWNKESFDIADWKEDKKICINGYTYEYVDKDTGSKYFPMTIIIDASKLDFENEKHMALLDFRLMVIGLKRNGEKLEIALKNNKYNKIPVSLTYQNGQELEEFTVDMLTEMQKRQYELGLKTLDQFRPAGQTYGPKKIEYRLVDFDLRGDYSDGRVELDDKPSEFEDEIVSLAKSEKIEDVIKEDEPKSDSSNDDIEDLFG